MMKFLGMFPSESKVTIFNEVENRIKKIVTTRLKKVERIDAIPLERFFQIKPGYTVVDTTGPVERRFPSNELLKSRVR